MANTYDEWFVDAREDSSFERADIETLKEFLDGSIGIDDAVQRLVDGEDCRDIGSIWVMFLVISKRYPEIHGNIANLINGIFAIPPDGEENHADWKEDVMRNFSINWRDVHDALWSDRRQMVHRSDPAGQHWINFHAFSAICIRDNLLTDTHWAYVIIIDGFERKVRHPITPQQDVDVAAASQYFIHGASDRLRNGCRNESGEILAGWDDESELWKGKRGLTPERWDLWRERARILRQTKELSDETREAARRAEVAIEKSDRRNEKKQKN